MSAAAFSAYDEDQESAFIPELIEGAEPPFHMGSRFAIAKFDMDNDSFQPQFWEWSEASGEHTLELQGPVFVTASEAIAWLRKEKGWVELRRDPGAPSAKYETHFVVRREDLLQVTAKCEELNLQLATSDVEPERVISSWGITSDHRFHMTSTAWQRLVERATVAAESYVHVHIRAPKAEKNVVAVAKLELGFPVFHTLEGHDEAFWTAERIANIDFKRCDQCNIRHERTKLFLVRNAEGDIEQYGGSCAKHLNLATLVNDHLRALKALKGALEAMGAEGEEGFGTGGGRRESKRVDPRFALVLADMMIAEHGYTSGKAAYHSNDELVSTKSHVISAMSLLCGWTKIPDHDWRSRAERTRLREKLAEYREERAQDLYDKAAVLVAEKLENEISEFTNNLNVAFQTGSLKLLGFLVWIPTIIRKHDAAVARKKIEANRAPWTASKDERPTTGTELASFIRTWYDSTEQFCTELGQKASSIEKVIAKGDKPLTKTLLKKLDRTVPGIWTVTHSRSWNGEFGTTFYFTMVRNDGAKILWKTGSPMASDGQEVCEGDSIRIIGATVGDIPKPFTTTKGHTIQDGRLINRVTCVRL